MKISFNWLSDFVDWKETDPEEIAAKLTVCTAEVEHVEHQGQFLKNCCVGKVVSLTKHPDADKLSLCDVKTDKGKKKVVCGGSNLREGMRVAFAHVGAEVLWHGGDLMTLEKTKIRGEVSEGMICTAEELDLCVQFPDAVDRVIVDMGDGDDGVGQSLQDYLGLDDTVIHVDNHAITHRPDLFSQYGFARECVALGLATWKKDQPSYDAPEFSSDKISFKHKVDCKELVARYTACTLHIDDVGETPQWMKRRLEAVGFRSLHLPIDITNYVMFEVGMPLHAFDVDDFNGDVNMRTAKKGEKLVTLDKFERELPDGAMVLSDKDGVFDLMCIMGGLRSSTKDSTKNIYLHSAVVDPTTIRKTIFATGLRTDAATIYEKSVPPVSSKRGLHRALQLFLELVPGATITSEMDDWGDDGQASPIEVSNDYINHLLGSNIDADTSERILIDLGFTVERSDDQFTVTAPLWRVKDIEGKHDIAEEVGRIYGLDKIEPELPMASIKPPKRDFRLQTLRRTLAQDGCMETLSLSLVGPSLLQKAGLDPSKALTIENPIGEELSIVQPSVLPGLLEHAENNIVQAQDFLKTFTVSHVFASGGGETKEFGLLIVAKRDTDLKEDPFLTIESLLSQALARTGYEVTLRVMQSPPPYAHPGRSAEVLVEDTVVGHVCELSRSVRQEFDLSYRTAACLVDIDALFAIPPQEVVAQSLSQFPAVTYDETIGFGAFDTFETLQSQLLGASELLESVETIDMYGSGKDEKDSITLRFVYRALDRTLKEEEVKEEHGKVLKVVT